MITDTVGATDRNGYPEPAWFAQFRAAYASASAFILHLNTADYAVPGLPLRAYLCKKLASREIIAIYNRAEGITFPLPTMERKARELLNMDGSKRSDAAANPLAALGIPLPDSQPQEWPRDPAAALPMLEKLLKSSAQVAVLIEYAETVLPATDTAAMSPADRTNLVTLARWGVDSGIQATGNLAFLIAGNLADLHPAVRAASACWKAIEIPLPDAAARGAFLTWYLAQKRIDAEMTIGELANATVGLSLIHVENVLLQGETAGRLTWDTVRQQKRAIIETEYAGLLEMLEPRGGFDTVGGMIQLKNWAAREIIQPARDARTADMPQGVILVGPPGTGKTYFVRALAAEIGFNAVALNLENILGGIVGTSERNLARALSVVRSLSPCLLFMDELDQSDASSRGQSSGNPVAKNLFSMLLRFLSDPTNRGRVVFIGASNRPDLIDPALLRFGRVDAIVPVLLPEIADRAAIARAAAESQNIALDSDAAALIASNSERYSAADVAALVTKARKIARNAGRPFVAPEDARQAIDTLRPATTKQADYLHPAGDRSLQRHGTAASPLRRPARGPRRTHQTDRGSGPGPTPQPITVSEATPAARRRCKHSDPRGNPTEQRHANRHRSDRQSH